VKGRLLLDVVVRKGSAILKLLSSEDKSLLIWWDTFLILDLSFDVFDGVSWFDIESDGLTSESLDEDLHTTSKSEDEMEGGLLLDVVIGESSAVFELLTSEDKSLLVWRNTFFVLDLGFDVLNGVSWLNIKGNGLTSEGLDEDLHTTSESKNEMESGLLLDVVVRKGSSILELLTSKNESLLIWWNTFLVLNLSLDIFNGVSWFDIEGDGLTSEGLDEDLHTTSESENEMEGRLLLDVVVLESSAVLKLLASEDESLLVWGNTFLVLNLGLDSLNGVSLLNLKGDSLSSESLNEDLHTTSESEDEMESGLLLDVVVGEGATVLKLLSSENEALLIRRDALLILDLSLDVLNGVGGLNIEGDGLAGESLHEDLHATTEAEDEMEGGLLLDVVVGQGAAILELLARKDETLLIGRDALLVLNLGLDVLDGVGSLDIKGDGLASQSLHEDLHTTTEAEDQVESGLLLDVVVAEGATVLELLTSEDEALLIRGDTLLVLDLGLDVVNGVGGLDLKSDGLASQGLHEDLHSTAETEDEVKSGLLLDVVVAKGAAVLKLLTSEDESLLIGRDALLVLDLGLHVVNGVAGLDLKGDSLASEGLDENLHVCC